MGEFAAGGYKIEAMQERPASEVVPELAPVVPTVTAPSRTADKPAVQGKIRHLVSEALDSDDMPTMDTPLMESGLDSLASVSFRNEVAKEFDLTLPSSLMFNYPSIGELASYIVERLSEE